MKLRHLLSLLATGSLLSVASAQYLGSNDFSTANIGSLGQYSLGANAGVWTVADGRLEYSSSLSDTSRALIMNGTTNSAYTEDWTASLTASNLAAPTNGYTMIGLQVFAAGADYGFFNVMAYRNSSGQQGILFEKGRTTDGTVGTYTFVSYIANETDFSDVLLRMSHNSTTKDITLGYSLDGGASYVDNTFFNPNTAFSGTYSSDVHAGSWYGTPTNGYSFRILGVNTGTDILDGNSLFADNFSVTAGATAIPEPSTYAALAGLGALGLVIWRRRQAKAAA
jgi:hypothetical protein